MHRLVLSAEDIGRMNALAADGAARYDSVDDPGFLGEAPLMAHELSRRVRSFLTDFRLGEPAAAHCTLAGYPIDQQKIGPTPEHWNLRSARSPVIEEEMLLVILGSLLGDCIAWATQQQGHVVHDIAPIKGHEGEQLGSGSEQPLWWHTEDAFHPYRGDYLGMLCLRNPDGVATTFATVDHLDLSDAERRLLFAPHYTIRPDESHLPRNSGMREEADGVLATSYAQIAEMNRGRDRVAVLAGDPDSPYVRIDPYFMDKVQDPQAQGALDHLVALIDDRLVDHLLVPGDICFIDNFKGVHGRRPFKARHDGQDRWLKRINITRDLRKSRSARPTAQSRVIFADGVAGGDRDDQAGMPVPAAAGSAA